MNINEYKEMKKQIEKEAEKKLLSLAKEYAFSNSTVRIGDIVEDHSDRIKVDKINFGISDRIPVCVYHGVRLTKKGEPCKRDPRTAVWQSNVKAVHLQE
jgi:hypothetical protein